MSTRGEAPDLEFEDVLLTGLARDGGLYVPAEWPKLSNDELADLAGRSYQDVALRVMTPYVGDAVSEADFAALIEKAYAGFDHQSITPLRQLGPNDWLLELYHGPTLAFKDVAMQLLGQLFDYALTKRGQRATVIVATSGDTGSAAIESMRGRDAVDIFVLHPHNRTSEVQRRQMTTVHDSNVHNIAIEGTFDDCQDIVKALFNDSNFRDEVAMAGVNSINWARVMAQTVYYIFSAVGLGAPARSVAFSVPTGNFGDVLAGYVAQQMGLPIEDLIIATNVNDILARTLDQGVYEVTTVMPTASPSMDIQISSNFERLLFDAYGRDPVVIKNKMEQLSGQGRFEIEPGALTWIRNRFTAVRIDEQETRATIKRVYETTGFVIDPHTAVGVAAAMQSNTRGAVPRVSLATAHPAKFPDFVCEAIGHAPEIPERLSRVLSLEERFDVLPKVPEVVKDLIRARRA